MSRRSTRAYTALVRGADDTPGVALSELYDEDAGADSNLGNLSTRGPVSKGDDVLIGGTIALGTEPVAVLVRAPGPSLAASGVSGTLADPVLQFHDSTGAAIASYDNWRTMTKQRSRRAHSRR